MIDMFTGAGAPLSQSGFDAAHAVLGGDRASLWSILTVETRGFGFLPDRRPKILFERHIFAKRTAGRYSADYPALSNGVPGGYAPTGAGEYTRLAGAMVLDRTAALESASWGLGQIMGFNARTIGYAGAEAMIAQFKENEDSQLAAVANFIVVNAPLAGAFRSQNWQRLAFYYNGANYAKNRYDTKLAAAHAGCLARAPSLDIRGAQARLSYLGFDTRGIDGQLGSYTIGALNAFQRSRGLPVSGALDSATLASLSLLSGV